MHQHHNHNLGNRIEAKGMEINARSQQRNHGHRKRASVKAKLFGILLLLSPIIAILWWANS
jgi:hypothetical protein